MSGKRGKLKETVEEDFETFVRHQLSPISDDLIERDERNSSPDSKRHSISSESNHEEQNLNF